MSSNAFNFLQRTGARDRVVLEEEDSGLLEVVVALAAAVVAAVVGWEVTREQAVDSMVDVEAADSSRVQKARPLLAWMPAFLASMFQESTSPPSVAHRYLLSLGSVQSRRIRCPELNAHAIQGRTHGAYVGSEMACKSGQATQLHRCTG